MDSHEKIITLADGAINLWVEAESSLHIKCVTKSGDPVELGADELKELIEILEKQLNCIQ